MNLYVYISMFLIKADAGPPVVLNERLMSPCLVFLLVNRNKDGESGIALVQTLARVCLFSSPFLLGDHQTKIQSCVVADRTWKVCMRKSPELGVKTR